MAPEDFEFRTINITPSSMTKRKRFAAKRAEELTAIQSEGWEIIGIEPERLFRRGDKVTVKRPARPSPGVPLGDSGSWWSQLDPKQQAAYGLTVLAAVILVLGIASML